MTRVYNRADPITSAALTDFTLTQDVIQTERLDLHHICAEDLITLYEDSANMRIYEGKEYSNPYRELMDDSGPLRWRVPQVRLEPWKNRWFVRWIVLRQTHEIIGSTSFHGSPDSAGMVEIGLGIALPFRNQGFAKEALRGMWLWAAEDPEVKILRYTVSTTNVPSIRLVQFFGFELVGQQIDDEDGPEDIYEMSADNFKRKFSMKTSEI
jgi:ribosomal-protein-alanine N-acetyltransferase